MTKFGSEAHVAGLSVLAQRSADRGLSRNAHITRRVRDGLTTYLDQVTETESATPTRGFATISSGVLATLVSFVVPKARQGLRDKQERVSLKPAADALELFRWPNYCLTIDREARPSANASLLFRAATLPPETKTLDRRAKSPILCFYRKHDEMATKYWNAWQIYNGSCVTNQVCGTDVFERSGHEQGVT